MPSRRPPNEPPDGGSDGQRHRRPPRVHRPARRQHAGTAPPGRRPELDARLHPPDPPRRTRRGHPPHSALPAAAHQLHRRPPPQRGPEPRNAPRSRLPTGRPPLGSKRTPSRQEHSRSKEKAGYASSRMLGIHPERHRHVPAGDVPPPPATKATGQSNRTATPPSRKPRQAARRGTTPNRVPSTRAARPHPPRTPPTGDKAGAPHPERVLRRRQPAFRVRRPRNAANTTADRHPGTTTQGRPEHERSPPCIASARPTKPAIPALTRKVDARTGSRRNALRTANPSES